MSIVERAADLMRPVSQPREEPLVVSEVKSAEPDLIERAFANDGLHSRSSPNANRVPAADAKPSHAPDSRQVSRPLHIDIAKLREQSVISPDGERTPNAESFRRIKRKILYDAVNPKSEAATNLVMVTSALPGEGGRFPAPLEAAGAGAGPAQGITLVVGDGHGGVVEGGAYVGDSHGHVAADLLFLDNCFRHL